ncbi:MAG: hypothetical protein ABIT71_07380 [Vicinamibacteraceae bacterium]
MTERLHDRRPLAPHRRGGLRDAVLQLLHRLAADLARRVLPGLGVGAPAATGRTDHERPDREPQAAPAAIGLGRRSTVDGLAEGRVHHFLDVAIADEIGEQNLTLGEVLGAGRILAPVPVDRDDLLFLAGRERNAVQQIAERVAVRLPHLPELQDVPVRDRRRLVEGRRVVPIDRVQFVEWRSPGSLAALRAQDVLEQLMRGEPFGGHQAERREVVGIDQHGAQALGGQERQRL